MKFNVYMIDDNEQKCEHLESFLTWLRNKFPAHLFHNGFTDPLTASQSASHIADALNDPFAVLLLDVSMRGPQYDSAAAQLALQFGVNNADVEKFREDNLKGETSATLASTIGIIAQRAGTRVAWCSRFEDIGQMLASSAFQAITWPQPSNVSRWYPVDVATMEKVLQPYCANAKINNAIVFAITGKCWEHDSLMGIKKGGALVSQQDIVSDWIQQSCDGESAKALFCPRSNKLEDRWRTVLGKSTYSIETAVLQRTLCKIGVRLICEREGLWKLPFQPGFPFLLCIAELCNQMSFAEEETFPPTSIVLSRVEGSHILRFNLNRHNKMGAAIDMAHFERRYHEVRCSKNTGRHATSEKLLNLVRSKIDLEFALDERRAAFFTGVPDWADDRGTNIRIEFDKSETHPAIEMRWTTDIP